MNIAARFFAICTCCFSIQLRAQTDVPNGSFEEADKSSVTQTRGWEPEGTPAACIVDTTNPYKGTCSMRLSSTSAASGNFFRQEFPFTSPGVRKYRLRCAIRTENLKGEAGVGARVLDKHGNTLTFAYEPLATGKNQAWQLADFFFYANEDAARIRLFGKVDGTGTAWFDAFTIAEMISDKQPSAEAKQYIDEYFRIVREHSVVQVTDYIDRLKIETLQLCAGCIKPADCHPALKGYSTFMLKDGHSFFSTPSDWKEMNSSGKMKEKGMITFPSGRLLESHVAYIDVPTLVSLDPKVMGQYADSLQGLIARMESQDPRGWIIDVSRNEGGNSFAMLAGIGPLIGNGTAGYSVSADGSKMKRIYRDGWTGWDSTLVFSQKDTYTMKKPGLPVAVIYGNHTASSGEVTAICFIGLPNARSFGQKTNGANTRIDNFKLSDGAWLNLASGYNADCNGNIFTGSLSPDVETDSYESAMAKAEEWVLKTNAGK